MDLIKGIYIPNHRVRDKRSKRAAENSLYNWKPIELTGEQWIEKLSRGHTIQPSTFKPTAKGTYSHAVEHWVETHFICADGDNIRNVEFYEKDILDAQGNILHKKGDDKNPNGIEPFDTPILFDLYPGLQDDLFAVSQSVSSMSHEKPPSHKRYRLIFQLDEPITSEAQYHVILLALAEKYPIIAPIARSPAQPVFGNARPETSEPRLLGNLLRLSDYPLPPVENRVGSGVATAEYGTRKQNKPCQKQTSDTPATDADLETYLAYNQIERTPRPKGGFFVRCENASGHTGGICKPKDAYVFVSDRGGFAKYCSHTSCKSAGRNTWQSFKDSYNLQTPPEISERYKSKYPGLIPTRNREIRLTPSDVLSDIKREALELTQEFTQEVMNKDLSGQVFVIRIDTGGGKTEQAILIKGARPIILVGGHDLGAEIYSRAKGKGVKAFLYRGLMHKPDGEFPFESPCIQPTVLDEYRKKGANAFRWGCEGCPVRSECEQYGMRWQHEQLSDPDTLMILAIPQLFIDPRYKSFIKNRLNLTAEDILFVDDASTEKIFLDEKISLAFLKEKSTIWKGTPLGDFAKAVKDIITENEPLPLITQLKSLVKATLKDPHKRTTIYKHLRKSRHYDPHTKKKIELSIDDAIKEGFAACETADDRKNLQTVEKSGWTTLDRFRIFFKEYPNPETAPMRYDATEHILHFTLPGQLYQTDAAIGFMGATIDIDIFKKVFGKGTRYNNEPQVFDAISTEYHPDSNRYQLRNNGNPRATLLKYQGKGELSGTGLEFFGYFKKFVEKNPDKRHALITYKAVIERYKDELDELGITYSWFHNTEGLDTHFAECEVFHVFGLPARTPFDVDYLAKVWGISPDEVKLRLITQELLQAIGRARLIRKPNTVILYTSHKVDGFSERALLTDENDWKAADFQLSQLPAVITEREKAEQTHQADVDQAIQSGDVQAVMDLTGKSERSAQYLTKDTRPQIKTEQDAERDAEIQRILDADLSTSLRQITAQLKAAGHKRTHQDYIRDLVNEIKCAKNANDIKYPNCRLRFSRSSNDVVSEHIDPNVETLRRHPEFDNIIRKFAAQSLTHHYFLDNKMHTAAEIADRTLMSEQLIESIIKDWYERVMISPGVGKSYWMNRTDLEKCQSHIEKEKRKALQHFLDTYNAEQGGQSKRVVSNNVLTEEPASPI